MGLGRNIHSVFTVILSMQHCCLLLAAFYGTHDVCACIEPHKGSPLSTDCAYLYRCRLWNAVQRPLQSHLERHPLRVQHRTLPPCRALKAAIEAAPSQSTTDSDESETSTSQSQPV